MRPMFPSLFAYRSISLEWSAPTTHLCSVVGHTARLGWSVIRARMPSQDQDCEKPPTHLGLDSIRGIKHDPTRAASAAIDGTRPNHHPAGSLFAYPFTRTRMLPLRAQLGSFPEWEGVWQASGHLRRRLPCRYAMQQARSLPSPAGRPRRWPAQVGGSTTRRMSMPLRELRAWLPPFRGARGRDGWRACVYENEPPPAPYLAQPCVASHI